MLVSMTQAAQELSVSIHGLRRWVAERKIPVVRLGLRVLIKREDLDRLVEKKSGPGAGGEQRMTTVCVQAEQAVLGAVLAGARTFKEIAADVGLNNFEDERHREIFKAMIALDQKGQTIEQHALNDELRKAGVLPTVGGVDYVVSLVFASEDPERLPNHIHTLQEVGEEESPIICMADVEPEDVSWLWYPYIPRGKLTLLEGDPGTGKSWVSLAIATAVSLGVSLPEADPFGPSDVLLLSAEDGLADTIRPRLDRMRADVSRVSAWNRPMVFDSEGMLALEVEIAALRPALVVIDPLIAYMGAKVDTYRANQTRAILAPLAEIAERHDISILAVRHLRKSESSKAIYRGQGSIDFIASARSVLLVTRPLKLYHFLS